MGIAHGGRRASYEHETNPSQLVTTDGPKPDYYNVLHPFVHESTKYVQIPNKLFMEHVRRRSPGVYHKAMKRAETRYILHILRLVQSEMVKEVSMQTHHLSYHVKTCAVHNKKIGTLGLLRRVNEFNTQNQCAVFEAADSLLIFAKEDNDME